MTIWNRFLIFTGLRSAPRVPPMRRVQQALRESYQVRDLRPVFPPKRGLGN